MAKVVLFNSVINALIITTLFTGCANRARDLPPDLSHLPVKERLFVSDKESGEYCMTCDNLKTQLELTQKFILSVENQLSNIQASNQAKGSIGILLLPPVILTMQNSDEISTEYRQLDERKERIFRIKNARECEW
ncbi:MAG: hypothetical protein Q7T77_03170 [Sulfuricurvum sp.]|nr:hypothetical protein [Sulfuricurvum sp.]